ncbi:hypothetical protein Y032_0045g1091 [Ancylostoma ceylanicum]|uniref:Metalloendopeptidase n=1 Tax=Ancylostoma ceylanicum TaxID=53326 RepID=A0A016UBT2_9BILA|nr:hypothetical protein Y032_0045g1091 [Ancylostoma ceylanicum]
MRVFLLVLLLAICASAGFFDTKLGEKIKKTLGKIKAALNGTLLMKIREKFIALREKIKAKLKLSPARKALLGEIMKHIIKIKKDKIQEKGDSIEEINSKSAIGELLYQGDIVLTNKQAQEIVDDIEGDENDRGKRQAFRDRNYPRTLWSKGVYYYFHGNATPEVRSVFTKGARLWMKDTCIDFFESNSAPDRIRVFKEQGCWSYVGRIGGQQDLSLGKGCESVGTAAHEIGHAIGFYHTHSRHDRDNFITFNAQNVKVMRKDCISFKQAQSMASYSLIGWTNSPSRPRLLMRTTELHTTTEVLCTMAQIGLSLFVNNTRFLFHSEISSLQRLCEWTAFNGSV